MCVNESSLLAVVLASWREIECVGDEADNWQLCMRTSRIQEHRDAKSGRSVSMREGAYT